MRRGLRAVPLACQATGSKALTPAPPAQAWTRRLDAEFWAQNLLCTEVQGSRPRLLLTVGAASDPHLLPSHGHNGYCSVGRGSGQRHLPGPAGRALGCQATVASVDLLPALPALPRGHEGSEGALGTGVGEHPQPGLPEALTALDLSRECAENRWADSTEADLPSLLEFATELPEEHSPGERSRDRVQGHGKQGCFG